jgi:hypothetical protein
VGYDLKPVRGKGIVSRWKDATQATEAILLLTLGVLVCLAFLNSPGTGDREDFLNYMAVARQKGILAAYPNAGPVDYPPLSFVLLGLLSRIADILRIGDFKALKLSLMVLTLACAGVTGFLRRQWRPDLAVFMFLTLVIDAMLDTYIDVYFLVFLLIAIYCFERGYVSTGTVFFAIASLVKWQPIILGPLVVLYAIPRRPALFDFVRLIPAAALSLVIFLFYDDAMIGAFARGYENARLSGQALNLNWLITGFIESHHPLRDGLVTTLSRVGNLFVSKFSEDPAIPVTLVPSVMLQLSSLLRYFCYAISLYYFYISDRSLFNLLRTSIVCFMCYFIFGYGVHEQHACIPAALAICWFAIDRTRFVEAVLLAVIFNVNILLFYGLTGSGLGFDPIVGWDVTLYLSGFNLILFLVLWLPIAVPVGANIVGVTATLRAKLSETTSA